MKKAALASAVVAALISGSTLASTIYSADGNTIDMGGRAEARLSMQDGEVEDKTRVRLNFKGKVQITDELYGVGFYEGEFTTSDFDENGDDTSGDDTIDNRYAYAGLGGAFGEITYGKNEGALGVVTDFTDIMAYHGNSAADKLAVADRTDNMITYKGTFDDLSLKASYRFADRSENSVTGKFEDNDADGYSLSAIYSVGDTGFRLGGGYADQDEADEFMVAASYAINDFYFAGIYTDGQKDKRDADYTGYEFAAAYTMGQAVFTTTYNNDETDDDTSADNIAVDATYYFKPNFRGYISYNFNLIDDGDDFGRVGANSDATEIEAEDELAIGLRYDF